MVSEKIPQKIVTAVRQIAERELLPYGYESLWVAAGADHDGDPAILIDIDYRNTGQPVEPKVIARLVSKVRDRLWEVGETRFPHIRHHFAQDQKVVGDR
jgi:hypothetical protein